MTDTEPRRVQQGGDGSRYIRRGTWLRDRRDVSRDRGVVSGILDCHDAGTVRIEWHPNSTEFISAPMFRERLMSGEWAIDDGGSNAR